MSAMTITIEPIKGGYAARHEGIPLTAHGRTEEEARQALARLMSIYRRNISLADTTTARGADKAWRLWGPGGSGVGATMADAIEDYEQVAAMERSATGTGWRHGDGG